MIFMLCKGWCLLLQIIFPLSLHVACPFAFHELLDLTFLDVAIFRQRTVGMSHLGYHPRPVTVENYFPYIQPPRKSTTVWRPLEFPVFGGPNCSAGLGVREPRLSNPEFGIWSFQILGAPTVQEVWAFRVSSIEILGAPTVQLVLQPRLQITESGTGSV